MKNKSLTILTPYFPTKANRYGGIFVYDQVNEMAKHVQEIDVYVTRPWFKISRKFPFIKRCGKDLSLIKLNHSNVNLKLVRYIPFPKDTVLYHLSLAASLFISKHKFTEYLLVHTIYPLGTAIQYLKLTPTVIIHGSDFRYFSQNPKQSNLIFKSIDKLSIVCVSKGLWKEIKESRDFIGDNNNICVIENGVKIISQPEQIIALSNASSFHFVFVGSLIKLKGVYELLEAFKQLQKTLSQCSIFLTFIGEGIEKKTLKNEIERQNIKNVSFAGSVGNDEVMEILSTKDCLVLPSYQEGFGRVIIEMLSLGKPVISTESGGPEYILNVKTGLIVPPQNVALLSDAMKNIIKNYELYSSNQIQEYVQENYSLEKQTLKLLDRVFRKFK